MGDKNVTYTENTTETGRFIQQVIKDLKALEHLLSEGKFEKSNTHIGAELELNFLDQSYNPYPVGTTIHQKLKLPNVVTEYARFNLEINSDPILLKRNCLSALKQNLNASYKQLLAEAKRNNAHILLSGIIPTLTKADIPYEALTPEPRFKALYDIRKKKHDSNYEFNIRGMDELIFRDNLMLFAGAVTSYQMHLQICPLELADKYNWAQMIAGPLLASATYSPIFLGKKLWHETRIALFEQSADVRMRSNEIKEEKPRVDFGRQWVQQSILELLQEDLAAHEPLLITQSSEDPFEEINQGKTPGLKAWTFFNGSVYRWNRICYGITASKPTLRIENRMLPAGPTLEDQIANTAFWVGMMRGMPDKYKNIQNKIPFDNAKQNFLQAARVGLEAQFKWLNQKTVPAGDLILGELLPIARRGLAKANVDADEAAYYLDIIEQRVATQRTGSNWMIDSYNTLLEHCKQNEALATLTAGMVKRQESGDPVHTWSTVDPSELSWENRCKQIRNFMTTSLYRVREDTVVDLAARIMEWKKIGHVIVEDDHDNFVGLINKDIIINFLLKEEDNKTVTHAGDIMITQPVVVNPRTSFTEAINLILERQISSLPVVEDGRAVGIVTRHDFIRISKVLVETLNQET